MIHYNQKFVLYATTCEINSKATGAVVCNVYNCASPINSIGCVYTETMLLS